MNRKRISPVRSTIKAATGGGILVGALIALAFFKGSLGLGDGDGTTDESAEAMTTVAPDSSQVIQTQAPAQESNTNDDGLTAEERSRLQSGQLTLLIDERNFLLQTEGGDEAVYQPIELARIINLADQTTGDANGIRVVIQRRETARATAENLLREQLRAIGIDENAVHMPGNFIP